MSRRERHTTPAAPTARQPIRRSPHLLAETVLVMAATSGVLLLIVWLFAHIGETGPHFTIAAPVGFGMIAAAALVALPAHPYPRFGWANVITTARAGLTALIGALVFESDRLAADAGLLTWLATGVAGVALGLDGLDGYTARRRAETSRFGARFDMEIDALLILLLCALLTLSGKIGAWVLAIGLMRYGFMLAQWIWLELDDARLDDSILRKTVCVVQGVVLCIGLAPVVPAPIAALLAAIGLGALCASFTRDICWLVNTRDT